MRMRLCAKLSLAGGRDDSLLAASSLRQAVHELSTRNRQAAFILATRTPCAHPLDCHSVTPIHTLFIDSVTLTLTHAHHRHLRPRFPAHTERASIQTDTTYTQTTSAVMAAKLNEDEYNLAMYVYAASLPNRPTLITDTALSSPKRSQPSFAAAYATSWPSTLSSCPAARPRYATSVSRSARVRKCNTNL